ncbi:hypothetical protein PHMEG_0005226 [Phytophthora megakarya]|uniref:Uncharacterized protein n=1 Tax=Phytophthora megakarya TaxID=4795 RepID=A0A225WTN3_9STRA|nr:hypothetical protein PHMEG_0005226 [Phytophthora megakarya]
MYDCITYGISAGSFLDESCAVTNLGEVRASYYEYCCLLHTTSTIQCAPEDLILTNSNFVASGAAVDAISPECCRWVGLEKRMFEHGVDMPITLVNQQDMVVPKRTVRLHLFIDLFRTYVNRYFHHGFFSTITGETKYITSKQFSRIIKKPEWGFVVRPVREKEQTDLE